MRIICKITLPEDATANSKALADYFKCIIVYLAAPWKAFYENYSRGSLLSHHTVSGRMLLATA